MSGMAAESGVQSLCRWRQMEPPSESDRLSARLASGRYDALSGRFLGIDDDLDELLNRTDEIVARELYTLHIQR